MKVITQRHLLPDISEDLLDHLRQRFPDRLPDNPVTAEELARRIGQQDVIRFLSDTLRMQERQ